MVQEFTYWQNHHLVEVVKDNKVYFMVRFNCQDNGPRPESYLEDYEVVQELDESDKSKMYWELKTGAESGWDFSSRWGGDNLLDTKIRSIIPVDLNCFYALNARILAEYSLELFNDFSKAENFNKVSDLLTQAIDEVLWDSEDGIWYDYDIDTQESRKNYSPSNLTPLWTETYCKDSSKAKQALQYFLKQNLQVFPGGLPTTLSQSGQQWDFPNCWPPLEHIIVQGLEKTEIPEAKELAYLIAEKRVRGAYTNFLNQGHMFEKYDATSINKVGGGGEYEVQIGFGWTNGVVLDFLDMYSDRLTSQN